MLSAVEVSKDQPVIAIISNAIQLMLQVLVHENKYNSKEFQFRISNQLHNDPI